VSVSGPSKLEELIVLAREPSSERRRELLREVTDLFFTASGPHGPQELELFDGVLDQLATDMEVEVRAELADRMTEAAQGPTTLIASLAADEAIAVAGPVLARSPHLSEDVLLDVARTRGQAHLRAISGRPQLTEAVADVVVDRGDDVTLGVLLRNAEAPLSREAAEKVVDRATGNPDLHQAVVDRQTLPIDLLNEMYFVVEHRLRERITARNAALDPATLDAALEAGRKRLASRDGTLPSDFVEAEAYVRDLALRGGVTPAALAAMLRNGHRTRFLVALGELSEIDFHTVRRIVDRQELDALAIICKAADFDRALFLTFAVLILEPGRGMALAEEYGRLYGELPRETAMRTLRFWRMRRQTGDIAAA
jgi:uncharacterized protein (DUF2336 family)